MTLRQEFTGQLNQRVTWEQPVETPDGAGGALRNWQAVGSLWARIQPRGQSGEKLADHQQNLTRYEVTLRFVSGLRCGDRLIWRGDVLSVDQVTDPDGQRQILTLSCTKRETA